MWNVYGVNNSNNFIIIVKMIKYFQLTKYWNKNVPTSLHNVWKIINKNTCLQKGNSTKKIPL